MGRLLVTYVTCDGSVNKRPHTMDSWNNGKRYYYAAYVHQGNERYAKRQVTIGSNTMASVRQCLTR